MRAQRDLGQPSLFGSDQEDKDSPAEKDNQEEDKLLH
jgi:hypothetical protein